MAMIDNAHEVYREVWRLLKERAAEVPPPDKILMSKRQFDVMAPYVSEPSGDAFMYGVPVVICPDCDLYVPSAIRPL